MLILPCAAAAMATAVALAPGDPATDAAVSRRLADAWTREGFSALEHSDIVPADLACGLALFRAAADLRPDSDMMWRHLLRAAQLAGPLVPEAEEASRTAVAAISRLAPNDQVIRLQRIVDAVDARDTAEGRIAALRGFLEPEAVKVIGAPVASRLAFDLALLESRRGSMDAFAKDIATALSLSPAFPAAAQTAAGFFAERADDPIGEAELLVTAVMADPGDERMLQRLGNLLLQYGAYGSAARVYRMAADAASAAERSQSLQDTIASDAALALWMGGRPVDALEVLRKRSQRRASAFLEAVLQQNPNLTRSEAEAIPPLVPTINLALEVAIVKATGDQASADAGLNAIAAAAASQARLSMEQKPPLADTAAETLLEGASAVALLGGSAEAVNSLVSAADRIRPLTEQAKGRYAAWNALNAKDPAKAVELFKASPSDDPATLYGLARAEAEAGDRQAGMRALLDLARRGRSLLPGALAAEEIRTRLGSTVPSEEVAARLDAIVAGIPPVVDRLLAGSERALGLMIECPAPGVRPFDPVPLRVRVQNRTSIPLAIDVQGPVERTVAIVPRLSITSEANVLRMPPIIVPIDTLLELHPGQSADVEIDLMWFAVGRRVVESVLDGAQVGVRGSLNFLALPGTIRAGSLGADTNAEAVRVDGVPQTAAWIEESIAMVQGDLTDAALVRAALLLHQAANASAPEAERTRASEAACAAFARWPARARTWMALCAPRGDAQVPAFAELAWKDPDPAVRAAATLAFATDPRQPGVEAALASADAFERAAAGAVVAKFERERARIADRLRLNERVPQAAGPGTVPDIGPPTEK